MLAAGAGTWARGKPLLRRLSAALAPVRALSAGGFVGNKGPPRGAAL